MVEENKKTRRPTAKKNFSLNDFKKKIGGEDVPQKPLTWLKCNIQEATGLPGIPIGYATLARGFTNTGKSTILAEALVDAQKQGIFPIIIDTENNMGRNRLARMGFDWDNDFYLMIDNDFLLENYGKKQDPKRSEASIEDLGSCIHHLLDLQENGELPYDLLFAIDSFGTLDCIRSINASDKGSSDNNMWNAGAFEKTFKYLLNNRLPSSRKVNKKYINTLIASQKIWINSQNGAGTVQHKGGEAAFYGARLVLHFGGIQSHGTKKVNAISKKREVTYGIETKVGVVKNQIDGNLGGIALEGKIISTPTGFITANKEDIDQYKKDNIQFFRDVLGGDITAEEIETKLVDIQEDEKVDFAMPANDDFDNE
ncbi:MAG: hypothetical protein ACOCVF_00445 [bacterium]